ncbi:MAG: hypothetical protein ACK5H2_13970 [Beutenbergiaceae bacterium]
MKVLNGASAIRRSALAAGAGFLLVGSLVACSGDPGTGDSADDPMASEAAEDAGDDAGGEDDMAAIEADLVAAQEAVAAALEKYPDASQITLTDAVEEPSMEYGSVSAPFMASEAVESVGQVLVTDGSYTITVTSTSGNEYSIDQDGNLS